jgi:hypothetical protein
MPIWLKWVMGAPMLTLIAIQAFNAGRRMAQKRQ